MRKYGILLKQKELIGQGNYCVRKCTNILLLFYFIIIINLVVIFELIAVVEDLE